MTSPQVRMDKSREHSTIHGERTPDDPHAGVHFYQDGLPFDAQGILCADHRDLQGDSKQAVKLREIVERKMKKASKSQKIVDGEAPAAPADDDDEPEAPEADDNEPVNLEAWARGEQKVAWNDVSQAIARRFKRRVTGKLDAIEFLIEQKVIAKGALSAEHAKLFQD